MSAKVCILGSGASAEDGAPLMSELIDQSFRKFKSRNFNVTL